MKIKKWFWLSILFIGATIMTGVVFVLYPGFFSRSRKAGTIVTFPEKNIVVQVELARTPYEWSKGLMFREALPEGGGMLFVFPNEAKQSFWMKNTLIPLDMLFISKDKKIVTIQKNAVLCKTTICPTYDSSRASMYVLEVDAGFADRYGIKEGTAVEIQY